MRTIPARGKIPFHHHISEHDEESKKRKRCIICTNDKVCVSGSLFFCLDSEGQLVYVIVVHHGADRCCYVAPANFGLSQRNQ